MPRTCSLSFGCTCTCKYSPLYCCSSPDLLYFYAIPLGVDRDALYMYMYMYMCTCTCRLECCQHANTPCMTLYSVYTVHTCTYSVHVHIHACTHNWLVVYSPADKTNGLGTDGQWTNGLGINGQWTNRLGTDGQWTNGLGSSLLYSIYQYPLSTLWLVYMCMYMYMLYVVIANLLTRHLSDLLC